MEPFDQLVYATGASAIRPPIEGLESSGVHVLRTLDDASAIRLFAEDDAGNRVENAIVAYLRSIPAIRHEIPRNVPPGQKAPRPFVYFGVYESRRR